jgi:hypothetical protein
MLRSSANMQRLHVCRVSIPRLDRYLHLQIGRLQALGAISTTAIFGTPSSGHNFFQQGQPPFSHPAIMDGSVSFVIL